MPARGVLAAHLRAFVRRSSSRAAPTKVIPAPRAGTRPVELPSLTGLRFYAALLVFLAHTTPDNGSPYVHIPVLSQASAIGGVGVSFFYILSGFILTWSGGDRQLSTKGFYLRRFARIYPLHLLTTLVVIPFVLIGRWESWSWSTTIACVLLVQAWIPVSTVFYGMNGPSWSLSCEAFFYAIFPFVAPQIRKMNHDSLLKFIVGVAGAGLFVAVAVEIVLPGYAVGLTYVLPAYRVYEFLIGIALAAAMQSGRTVRVPLIHGMLATVLAYALAVLANQEITARVGSFPHLPLNDLPTPFASLLLGPAFALLIVTAAARDLTGKSSPFSGRRAVRLGNWSFAFYLSHSLILRVLAPIVPDDLAVLPAILVEAGTLVAAIGLSAALHQLFERPVATRIRAFAGAAPRVAKVPPSKGSGAGSPDPDERNRARLWER